MSEAAGPANGGRDHSDTSDTSDTGDTNMATAPDLSHEDEEDQAEEWDGRFLGSDWCITNHKYFGEPDGFCDGCEEHTAHLRCPKCNRGKFCRLECVTEWSHHCDMPMSAEELWKALNRDQLPTEQAWDDFCFARCPNHQHEVLLFGIYSTLRRLFSINKFQFDQWQQAGRIYDNIVCLCNRALEHVPIANFYWLHVHGRTVFRFEKRTEKLDVEAYLVAHAKRQGDEEPRLDGTLAERMHWAWTCEPMNIVRFFDQPAPGPEELWYLFE